MKRAGRPCVECWIDLQLTSNSEVGCVVEKRISAQPCPPSVSSGTVFSTCAVSSYMSLWVLGPWTSRLVLSSVISLFGGCQRGQGEICLCAHFGRVRGSCSMHWTENEFWCCVSVDWFRRTQACRTCFMAFYWCLLYNVMIVPFLDQLYGYLATTVIF